MKWLIRQYRGFRILLARLTGGSVNVAWFGASPTRNDNYVPIQRALDAASSVTVPPGHYELGSSIDGTKFKDCRFVGR